MGLKSTLQHFTIPNILFYSFSIFIIYKSVNLFLLKTMFKSTKLYQRRSLASELSKYLSKIKYIPDLIKTFYLVSSNNFKIWRKSIPKSSNQNQKVLKFLVSKNRPSSIDHISCPLISTVASDSNAFIIEFQIKGEYNSRIDEIDFYDFEEKFQNITTQNRLKDDIKEMLTKYIKTEINSKGLRKKSYFFQLDFRREEVESNNQEQHIIYEAKIIVNTEPNFDNSIL